MSTAYTNISNLDTSLNNYYNISEIDTKINSINTSLDDRYTKAQVDTKIQKIDASLSEYYTKTEVDASLSEYYTKTEVDASLSEYYKKTELDSSFTLIDNSINDLYDKFDDPSGYPIKVSSTIPSDNDGSKGEAIINENNGNLYINTGNTWKTITTSTNTLNNRQQTFIEIMTQQPNKFTISGSVYNEVIEWHYDDIMYKTDNYQAIMSFDNSSNSQKYIPHIDKIHIDVRKSGDTLWSICPPGYLIINDNSSPEIDSSGNVDICGNYNVSKYKKIKFGAGSGVFSNPKIDVRIYGINNSINYPSIDNRSIIFENVMLKPAKEPEPPIIKLFNIKSTTNMELIYDISGTEKDDESSNAKIENYDISYVETDYLYSNNVNRILNNISSSSSNNLNPLLSNDDDLIFNLTDLKPGVKYDFQTRIRNNLTNDNSYSIYSDICNNNYMKIPNSNYDKNINININITKKNISNEILNNNNVYYVNKYDNSYINMNNNQINFEISDTNSNYISRSGFGKFIDNSYNLLSITSYFNDIQKAEISYNGFMNSTQENYQTSGISNEFFQDISSNDNELNNEINKGFRINGTFKLKNINIDSINEDASKNVQKLKYIYKRNNGIYDTQTNTTTFELYIDDLSLNPEISSSNDVIECSSVLYTIGIPSIKEFKLKIDRNYTNLNSVYKYILGDRKVSDINISITTTNSVNNIVYIPNNEINSNGTYNISNYEINLYYDKNINTKNNSNELIKKSETLYSLLIPSGNNLILNKIIDVSYNHYCDYDSYNKTNNIIMNTKLTCDIYEISSNVDIRKLENDLGGIQINKYNDTTHETLVKDWTLLYINGRFQYNSYPNVNDFSWSNLVTHIYNGGDKSYDLSGNSSNDGYKWIVFKLNKNGGSYNFDGNNYNIKETDEGVKYISFNDIFSKYLTNQDLDNMFDSENTDIVGFCRATTNPGNYVRVGNFKTPFEATEGIWSEHSETSLGYNSMNNKNGSFVEYNNDNGIYINFNAINDDLEIFIGMKKKN